MSTPEDKKFDFDNLNPSEDLSGELEPTAKAPSEGLLPKEGAEAEAKTEAFPTEETDKREQAEAEVGKGAAIPLSEKIKVWLEELKTADPFTVMLGLTVAALLIAILCCLVELGRYHFNVSAKKAVAPVTMTMPSDIHHWFC